MFRRVATMAIGMMAVVIMISMVHAPPVHASTLYDDAVSYWKFDDGSGLTAADFIGSNNGTLTNGPIWTTGKIGGALNFDGGNDYVNAGSGSNLNMNNGNVTIALWFKADAFTANYADVLLQHTNLDNPNTNYSLYVRDASQKIAWGMYNSGWGTEITGSSLLNTGEWYYAAVVFQDSGTTATLYLNGVSNGSGNTGMRIGDNVGAVLTIGRSHVSNQSYFNGLMDEVAVWNDALSANEVDALYKTGYIAGADGGLSLGYTTDEMNQLSNLYYQFKYLAPEQRTVSNVITSDGKTWTFTSDALPGSVGSYGTSYNGHAYYINLGSGLYGDSGGGAVPEPATVFTIIGGLFMAAYRRVCKRSRIGNRGSRIEMKG